MEDISAEALNRLKAYEWPGNVRELQNIIGRSMINMKYGETIIEESHLPKLLYDDKLQFNRESKIEDVKYKSNKAESLKEIMDRLERETIIASLKRNNDNRTAAAKELQISIRNLYYKIEKYEIDIN